MNPASSDVVGALAGESEASTVLGPLLDLVESRFTGAMGSLLALDGGTVIHVSRDLPSPVARCIEASPVRTAAMLCNELLSGSEALAIVNTDDPRLGELGRLAGRCGVRRAWLVPIRRPDQFCHAVLCVYFPDLRDADETARRFLVKIAELATVVLHSRNLSQRMIHQVQHDPLTGVPNRLLLRLFVEEALRNASRDGRSGAMIKIEIDQFKRVSDGLGPVAGDLLVQQIAERLSRQMDSGQVLGRVGDDEFAVLIPEVADADAALGAAERLIASLAPAFEIPGTELCVSGTAAVSLFPADAAEVWALERTVDAALARARNTRRGSVVRYLPELDSAAIDQVGLERDLRSALPEKQLLLHYQAQVNPGCAVTGFEALLRWRHPSRGWVGPATFIPVAEACGLIPAIGEWVLGEATSQLLRWRQQGFDSLTMAVNISPIQFMQDNFLEQIGHAKDRVSSGLELEITEGLLMRNVQEARQRICRLRCMGVPVAIDDFGTGYSSLAYLQRLPVDAIKIDRSFVSDLDSSTGPGGGAIVRAIISLAKHLGLRTIAEGVETPLQHHQLAGLGCNLMQGYLYSRPVHAEQAQELLRRDIPLPLAG